MSAIGMPSILNANDTATYQTGVLQGAGQAVFDNLSRSLPDVNAGASGNFSYTVTLAPGIWRGREHMWVGDTVTFVCKRGRLDINHKMRIVQIQIDIDQNNTESISLTLNWP